MAWNLSTGAVLALLGGTPNVKHSVVAATISFGDGDGAGATDTINDSGNGLAGFKKHSWILAINPNGTNHNLLVKALTVVAGKIEVPAGAFATEAAGTALCLVQLTTASVRELFANSNIDIYDGSRPANADLAETGIKGLSVTLNGDPFVAGEDTNGLNIGEFSGNILKRAIDPETGVTENWSGDGEANITAGWARWYNNAKVTGASSSAIRMDGVVAQSDADLNMVNGTSIVIGVASEVSDVSMTMTTA